MHGAVHHPDGTLKEEHELTEEEKTARSEAKHRNIEAGLEAINLEDELERQEMFQASMG